MFIQENQQYIIQVNYTDHVNYFCRPMGYDNALFNRINESLKDGNTFQIYAYVPGNWETTKMREIRRDILISLDSMLGNLWKKELKQTKYILIKIMTSLPLYSKYYLTLSLPKSLQLFFIFYFYIYILFGVFSFFFSFDLCSALPISHILSFFHWLYYLSFYLISYCLSFNMPYYYVYFEVLCLYINYICIYSFCFIIFSYPVIIQHVSLISFVF